MLCDIRGPRPAFFTMADRLAREGFLTLLPNVYYRLGHAPVPDLSAPFPHPETLKVLQALKATLTPERMDIDSEALISGLAAFPETARGAVAVVGYCMTGAFAMRAAAIGGKRVAAAASYHGGGLVTPDASSPHLLGAAISAEMYFAHADGDPLMPAQDIKVLEQTFEQDSVRFKSEIYEGASHGFAVPGPRFDPKADGRHWQTLLDLLGRNLTRPEPS
jgi:carboxymethylenebutenolidase